MSYGGGFLSGSQGGHGSGNSPGGGKQKNGPPGLRPVVISQINDATQAHPDAEYFIENVEVKDITFIACVRNKSSGATNISYTVEDGTGQIDARQWIETVNEEGGSTEDVDINTYVRILGSLKTFSGKRSVNCTRVRKIEDMNEISFHLVEVAYATMYHRNGGRLPHAGGNTTSVADALYNNTANPYANQDSAVVESAASKYSNLSPPKRRIMIFVAEQIPSHPDGITATSIVRHLSNLSEDQVKEHIEELCSDGELYETLQDHYLLA